MSAGDLHARPIRGPRADGRWYWRCQRREGGRRVNRWAGWATREEAIRALADIVAGHETPAEADGATTVRDLLELYVGAVLTRGDIAPRTGVMRRMSGDRLCHDELLRATRLDRLDLRALERHRDARLRQRGDAPSTVRLDLGTLGAAWRWGRRVGVAPDRDLPIPKVVLPEVDRFRPTAGQLAQVIAWLREERAGSPWAARIVEVYAATGARLGELSNLRWRDLRGGFLHVVGKRRPRVVPLPPDVAAKLEALRGAPDSRMWGPTPSSIASTLSVYLVAASADLGLPGVCSTHAIRRYVVDEHRRSGVHVATSARLLGHSPTTSLRYYQAPTEDDLVAAVGQTRLGRLPRGEVRQLVAHSAGTQTAGTRGARRTIRAAASSTR